MNYIFIFLRKIQHIAPNIEYRNFEAKMLKERKKSARTLQYTVLKYSRK